MAELGTVPPNVTHVAALETASVLGLPLFLLGVLVLVVLLLLHSAQIKTGKSRIHVTEFPLEPASSPGFHSGRTALILQI